MLVEGDDPRHNGELGELIFSLFLLFFPFYSFPALFPQNQAMLREACFDQDTDETLYMTRANGRISMYYESSEQCWDDEDTF